MSTKGSVSFARETGQSTVEWIGLVIVVTALILGMTAGVRSWLSGVTLVESVALRLLCAVGMSPTCAENGDLVAAYGPELAAEVEENAPEIVYEKGMGALPVDFRGCRNQRCGSAPESGPVWRSDTGEPAAAFVHVVDCRTEPARTESAGHGYDCGGDRAGHVYVQYWTYYSDSSWWGGVDHHDDDWEGLQVRVSPEGAEGRATSHQGYNYSGGVTSWPSDAGITHRSAWGDATGKLYVSGGTHAGHVYEHRRFSIRRLAYAGGDLGVNAYALASNRRPPAKLPRHLTATPPKTRWTPASHLVLIPIETLDSDALATRFAITPPWEKRVYSDPEDRGT